MARDVTWRGATAKRELGPRQAEIDREMHDVTRTLGGVTITGIVGQHEANAAGRVRARLQEPGRRARRAGGGRPRQGRTPPLPRGEHEWHGLTDLGESAVDEPPHERRPLSAHEDISRLLKEAAASMKADVKGAVAKLEAAYEIAKGTGVPDDAAVVAEGARARLGTQKIKRACVCIMARKSTRPRARAEVHVDHAGQDLRNARHPHARRQQATPRTRALSRRSPVLQESRRAHEGSRGQELAHRASARRRSQSKPPAA